MRRRRVWSDKTKLNWTMITLWACWRRCIQFLCSNRRSRTIRMVINHRWTTLKSPLTRTASLWVLEWRQTRYRGRVKSRRLGEIIASILCKTFTRSRREQKMFKKELCLSSWVTRSGKFWGMLFRAAFTFSTFLCSSCNKRNWSAMHLVVDNPSKMICQGSSKKHCSRN